MPNARPVCFYTDTDESESLVIQLHIKKRRGDRERKRLVVASVQPFVNRKKKQEISIRETCRNMRDEDWM